MVMEVVSFFRRRNKLIPYYNVPYTRKQNLQYLKLEVFTCHGYIIQQNVLQPSIHQELHVICHLSFLEVVRHFVAEVRVKLIVTVVVQKRYLKA